MIFSGKILNTRGGCLHVFGEMSVEQSYSRQVELLLVLGAVSEGGDRVTTCELP